MAKQSKPPSPQQSDGNSARSSHQRSSLWVLGSLILVLIAPFLSILLIANGRILGHWRCDSATAYYHFVYFLGECLRDGIMPLWNPHIMLGIPFIGEGQASVFHPVSFFLTFAKAGAAVNWIVATSFVLTGVFFFGYLRALRLSNAAAWAGAITWSFSSVMISRIYAGHLNILLTFISIPLFMLLWERLRHGGGLRYLVGIAFTYALMILAFYPQVLYIFSLFFLFYVAIETVMAVVDGSSTVKAQASLLLKLSIFVAIGIGVGAIQLLPSLDFVSRSFRQESTIDFCGTFSFPPENLLTMIAPQFFGTGLFEESGRYWGRNLFWEMWIYIGILPLILAAVGAWFAPANRRVPLLCCAAIFIVLGFGKYTPLYPFLYDHMPFFNVFRGSSKNTLITLFCLVVLSAYGFEALFGATEESQRKKFRRAAAITGVVLFVVCLAVIEGLVRDATAPNSNWQRFIVWLNQKPVDIYYTSSAIATEEFVRKSSGNASAALSRAMFFIVMSLLAIFVSLPMKWRRYSVVVPLAVIGIDLLSVFLPLLQTFDRARVQAPLVLNESFEAIYPPRILVPWNPVPNQAIRSGYSSPFGYTGNTLRRYNDLISHAQLLNPRESRAESKFVLFTPYFNMLGFDAVALEPPMVAPKANRLGALGNKILIPFPETNAVPGRAFLAAAPTYFSQREEALAYVLSNQFKVVTSPAIERTGAPVSAHPLGTNESVRVISFSPNKVELEVHANFPREVVYCGMYDRNWVAKINGTLSPVEPANYVFRAVQVPAGFSKVIFEYRPQAFYQGAAISAFSVAVLCALLAGTTAPVRRMFKRPSRAAAVAEMSSAVANV